VSDAVENNLAGGRLCPLDRVRSRIAVEKDIQFWNLGDPATVDLAVEFDGELHSHRLTLGDEHVPQGGDAYCCTIHRLDGQQLESGVFAGLDVPIEQNFGVVGQFEV